MWSDAARQASIAARSKQGFKAGDNLTHAILGQGTVSRVNAAGGIQFTRADGHTSILGDDHNFSRTADAQAATALANGHPKSGLTPIHGASAITKMVRATRLAFRNGS